MMDGIIDLMYQIAVDAMETGKDLSIEQKEYFHDAKGIGNIGGGHTEDTGVIMRVWQPDKSEEEADDNDQ